MQNRKCEFCRENEPKTKRNRFCSVSCSNRWHYKNGFELGFQKGHGNFDGAEKGWFTTDRVSGKKNVNYSHGKRVGDGYPAEFKAIRKQMLRNIRECRLCFKFVPAQTRSEHLVVHHIDGNINNNQLNNLRVMCNSCHIKLHRAQERRAKEVK